MRRGERMRRTAWRTAVACAVGMLLWQTGCGSAADVAQPKAPDPQDRTEAPDAKAPAKEKELAAAFTITLEYDTFGSFLPVTNHFWKVDEPTKAYAGFLVQLGDFKNSVPSYGSLQMDSMGVLARGEFKWIDVICDPTIGDGPGPLAPANFNDRGPNKLAPKLLPQGRGNEKHLVHGAMKPDSVALLTLWRGSKPLSVESRPVEGLSDYSRFVFSSQEACRVDVWKDLSSEKPDKSYKLGELKAIVVKGSAGAETHGGVHQPWWQFGGE